VKSGSLKVLSWNIENLATYVGAEAPAALASYVDLMGAPEVVCLQETRVRPSDHTLVAAMERALPGYSCHFALANDPKNVTFRGGRMYGVTTYVRERLTPSLEARTLPWDREGRVVITELADLQLAIVNVYAVNGTDKPYWDHELGQIQGDRHLWKRRFIECLGDECASIAKRGLALVMVGDWNTSRTKLDTHPRLRTEEPHATARAAFNDVFMPSLDVVDVFRELHPEAKKYTWFRRGARRLDAARVDFALVSRSLLPRVQEADIDERPEARLKSDHAPLWVTLALT
jgi:exodeoxyribonuclease-3